MGIQCSLTPNHDSLFSNHVCLIISTSSTQSQQTTKTPQQSQLNQNTQTCKNQLSIPRSTAEAPLLPQNWSWPANPRAPFPSISTYVLGFREFLVSLNKPTSPQFLLYCVLNFDDINFFVNSHSSFNKKSFETGSFLVPHQAGIQSDTKKFWVQCHWI